jgi:hypothetical protein
LVYVGSFSRRTHGSGRGSCRHKVAVLPPGNAQGKGDENEEMGKGGSTHGRGEGPGSYLRRGRQGYKGKGNISEAAWQGKGHEGKGNISEKKGMGYEGTDKNYEGKGNHGVEQGKDTGSYGAKGEQQQQQQWTSEGWGTYESGSTHDRGDRS